MFVDSHLADGITTATHTAFEGTIEICPPLLLDRTLLRFPVALRLILASPLIAASHASQQAAGCGTDGGASTCITRDGASNRA